MLKKFSVENYLPNLNMYLYLMSNDLMRPDCYFILKDNNIKAITELTEKELRQVHNLQKMYKAGAFNG